jgi:plastocyanin
MIKWNGVKHTYQMIDLRNILLILGVLSAVWVIGIWLPYKNYQRLENGSSATTSVAQIAQVQVRYTEKGFDPQTVAVKVGTTVAWINVSGRPMWVASDPHPTHTDLPGFDQKEIINMKDKFLFLHLALAHGDGIYEYTFTKIGAWKYHNHINPNDRGTVIVK